MPPQAPFSDAYINGLPPKRRKVCDLVYDIGHIYLGVRIIHARRIICQDKYGKANHAAILPVRTTLHIIRLVVKSTA